MTTQGLRVWFRDEIEASLLAVDGANRDIAQHITTPEMALYRRGFEAAIEAVARSFGITWQRQDVNGQEVTR
jgi:hypothetical protein